MASDTHDQTETGHGHTRLWGLTIGAIGVVFGDIGTSPLYAMREALHHARAGTDPHLATFGVISLVFWALVLLVTIKYVIFLMRADNKGEGGTLALMALAQKALGRYSPTVFFLGVCGAALFYGDSIITPALSVLCAVEGVKDAPGIGHSPRSVLILPISAVILIDPVSGAVQGHGQGWRGFSGRSCCSGSLSSPEWAYIILCRSQRYWPRSARITVCRSCWPTA